jgi:hypothetical protein
MNVLGFPGKLFKSRFESISNWSMILIDFITWFALILIIILFITGVFILIAISIGIFFVILGLIVIFIFPSSTKNKKEQNISSTMPYKIDKLSNGDYEFKATIYGTYIQTYFGTKDFLETIDKNNSDKKIMDDLNKYRMILYYDIENKYEKNINEIFDDEIRGFKMMSIDGYSNFDLMRSTVISLIKILIKIFKLKNKKLPSIIDNLNHNYPTTQYDVEKYGGDLIYASELIFAYINNQFINDFNSP